MMVSFIKVNWKKLTEIDENFIYVSEQKFQNILEPNVKTLTLILMSK